MTQVTYHTIPIINQIKKEKPKEMYMLIKVRQKNGTFSLYLASKYRLYCSIKYIKIKKNDILFWIKTHLKRKFPPTVFLRCGSNDHILH